MFKSVVSKGTWRYIFFINPCVKCKLFVALNIIQNTTVHITGIHTNWYIIRLIVYAMHKGITTKMCNVFLKAACETFSINTVRINYKLFENRSSKINDFQRVQNKGIIVIWRRNLVINSNPPKIRYLIFQM